MSYLYSKGNRLFGDIEFEDDTNTQIDFEDDYIGLVAGGSTILAVSDSSVGIGTTAPDTLLHLKGSSPAVTLQRDNNSTDTSTINFEGSAGVVACQVGQVAGSDNELAFSTHDGSNLLERMRIDEEGFVGIGTTSPEAYLDIKNTTNDGDTNRTMIQMYNYRADDADENDWAPTSIDFKIENVAGGVKGATARIATVIAPIGTNHSSTEGEKSSALIFSTMDDSTLSEAMRINNLGNVGIGTNSPVATLNVDGSYAGKVTSITSTTYTVAATDWLLVCSGAGEKTLALPAIANNLGRILHIKDGGDNASSNNIIIDPNSTETIDGESTYTINQDKASVTIVGTATEWVLVSVYSGPPPGP